MFKFQDYYNADNIGFLILKFPISMTLYTWRNNTVKSNKENDKKVTRLFFNVCLSFFFSHKVCVN